MHRIKNLTQSLFTLKCENCGTLLLIADRDRFARLSCNWVDVVDADLRAPSSTRTRILSPGIQLLCEKCEKTVSIEPTIYYDRLTTEQLQQLVGILRKLLEDQESNPVPSRPRSASLFKPRLR